MPNDRTNQIALALGDPFWNSGLFADHFLKDRIEELDEWKAAEGLEEAFSSIHKLYREKASRFRSATNEAQTERDFVRPVLDILWKEHEPGDCYQVQVNIPNVDARRQPDYAFFGTATDLDDAENRKGTLEYWRNVPALGDAKAWFASLDRQRGVDENPSSQIANYLYRSRVRWGILTNGRIWRLYEREKSSAGGIFFEVDLEEILRTNDLNGFKYFYLFFRREAFLPDATGKSFVDKIFQGSIDYATEVGERLKESVYDALRFLMNGFFEHSANALDRNDPETVKLVHENCLIVLYRLLFLLYAEDGGLLPCDEEPYHTYSLLVLHRQINQNVRDHRPFLPNTTMLWSHVCNLFTLIDEGLKDGERIIIPAYNGGLFSPSHYPHIAHAPQANERRWDIGDRYIAEAIDLLAYRREHWDHAGSQDIDYKTLDVRHLGSIYEGLLELQPHVASEPLVETLDDGRPVFKPAHEVTNPRPIHGQRPHTIGTSEIYLTTNRGERKATGSYYTPKYIVDYIVENAVGPLIDEATFKAEALLPVVLKEIRKLERGRSEWERLSSANADRQIANFNKLVEDQKRRLLESYLSPKILDPAMGSGHFLVGAADFISLAMATDPNLLVPNDIGDEDPQAHYKRLVVEHCLYGVDLNPLAVELAKLSLWLHTVSKDKALSFLDHHLRCGNSLIGARVEQDLMHEPPQFNARGRRTNANTQQLVLGFNQALRDRHLVTFLKLLRDIGDVSRHDAEGEKLKETLYAMLEAERGRFRAVADCWLAPYFGAPVSPQEYEDAVNALRGTDSDWHALLEQRWFQDVFVVAREKRSFHWELEFPEVFFDTAGFKPTEERGFDAVIGNPPYGIVFDEDEKRFWEWRFPSFVRNNDLYVAFVESVVPMCAITGSASMIVPNTFILGPYFTPLRRFLRESVVSLVDFGTTQIFDDPNVFNAVFILQRQGLQPASNERKVNFYRATLRGSEVARDIAPGCDSLLLLSATPHDGDPYAFHSLLGLLDPLRFPNAEEIKPIELEPIMVRRSKADIRKDDGTPLFPPRWVETTEVEFDADELRLYNEVTNYVREGYRAATALRDTAVGFLMVLLQKRMVSSIAAIRCSLERRLLALEHPEAAVLTASELRELKEREADEEALSDARREELQNKLESARLKLSTAQHQEEIRRVRNLLDLAKVIKVDSKAIELRKFVEGVLQKAPDEKILIFTEYTDTLDYLRDKVLAGLGPIAQIHGSMDMEEREEQEEYFQKPDVHLMVATDAAGEGLNLQFCHLMINYELPWNPNRIEQRIGRLHRYGQEHDVRVYNLQVVNTREGIILARLLHKIHLIEKQMGGYAPNVLGITSPAETTNLEKLSDLIISAIAEDTPPEVTAKHLEEVIEARRQMYDLLENSLFMPLHRFDKGQTDKLVQRSRELLPSNADIEMFVRRYFQTHEGRVENTKFKSVFRLRPPRRLLDGKTVLEEYPQVTFDKDTAYRHKSKDVQFVAFGHPLLTAIIRDCCHRTPKLRGAVTVKRVKAEELGSPFGALFNFSLRCSDAHDNTLTEDLLSIFVTAEGKTDFESANRLLAAEGAPVGDSVEHPQLLQVLGAWQELEGVAAQAAGEAAEKSFESVRKQHQRQADESLRSLEDFQKAKANRLKAALENYQMRLFEGEDMDISIRRSEYELERLDADCEDRRKKIEARRQVQANAPVLLNAMVLVTQ